MPNATAEFQGEYLKQAFNVTEDFTPIFLSATLPVCPSPTQSKSCRRLEDPPILLFFPGWAVSRFYYNAIASSIASRGYTVITVDSPSDASIITYPDGTVFHSNETTFTPEVALASETIRATDASFIISQLHNTTSSPTIISNLLPHRSRGPHASNPARVGMLGHSLGGAASIVAASRDSRIRAAINWDGTIFTNLSDATIPQPVLLGMDGETAIPPDWEAAWPRLEGPKLWVKVDNTTHQSFTDIGTLLEAAGLGAGDDDEQQEALAALVGTIKAKEIVEIMAEGTARWMGAAFAADKKGGKFSLGEEGLGDFEEVSTLKEGNL
jgi:dienelactone hydrolase